MIKSCLQRNNETQCQSAQKVPSKVQGRLPDNTSLPVGAHATKPHICNPIRLPDRAVSEEHVLPCLATLDATHLSIHTGWQTGSSVCAIDSKVSPSQSTQWIKHDMVWRTLQLLPRGSASWSAGKVCTMHTCAELKEAKLMYT